MRIPNVWAAVQIEWNHNGEKDTGFMTMGPMAGAIAESFPKEVKVPQQRISGGEELLFIRMTSFQSGCIDSRQLFL